jgi:hypothetical protein
MAHVIYTEHDYVLKQANIEDLIEDCSLAGMDIKKDEQRLELRKSFEKAQRTDTTVPVRALNLIAGWDDIHEEYYAVIRNFYDPQNLIAVLFERIVSGDDEDDAEEIIEKYFAVIEEKEKISLAGVREKLIKITADLKKTLALYENDEYTEEDLNRLSASLDKAYFDPIAELLEGVLVTIAGN